MKKYGVLVFAVLLVLHCYCIYAGLSVGRTVTKLLLLPCLLVYLYAASERVVSTLALAALVFSFLGDLLLALPGEKMFLLGMLAFTGTHLCNIVFFLRCRKTNSGETKGIAGIALVFITMVVVTLGMYVWCKLQGSLGDLQLPVMVYMVVISVMAMSTAGVLRNPGLQKAATRGFIPGALLFVLSDAILAMNKFLWHEQMADIAVMALYGMAQYGLVKGYIETTKPGEGMNIVNSNQLV